MARPARAIPDDFEETFVTKGWEGTPEHYGTRSDKVARWLDQVGRDELRQRRKNYVLGNRPNRGVSSLKPARDML
jgi:hypothetical protein